MRSTSKRVIYIEQPLYRYIISRGEDIFSRNSREFQIAIFARQSEMQQKNRSLRKETKVIKRLSLFQRGRERERERERETRKETPRRLILSIIRSRASFYNFSIRFEAINQPTPTPLRGEESSVSHESSLQTRIVVGFPVHARNKARFLAIRTAPLSRISLEK